MISLHRRTGGKGSAATVPTTLRGRSSIHRHHDRQRAFGAPDVCAPPLPLTPRSREDSGGFQFQLSDVRVSAAHTRRWECRASCVRDTRRRARSAGRRSAKATASPPALPDARAATSACPDDSPRYPGCFTRFPNHTGFFGAPPWEATSSTPSRYGTYISGMVIGRSLFAPVMVMKQTSSPASLLKKCPPKGGGGGRECVSWP